MSKFVKINDQPLSEVTTQDAADFFLQHIFFKMMDGGRESMKAGIEDLVDTTLARFEEYSVKSVNDATVKENIRSRINDPKVRAEMLSWYVPRIVSGLITGGTKEMRSEIFSCLGTRPNGL